MTITVTTHPETSPPSNSVEVSVVTGSVMESGSIYRNDHNGRSLLRTQPTPGFDSRTVVDYECPYEENVTYDWESDYTDPSAGATVFDETWASLSAWTVASGAWTVSGGLARNNGAYPPNASLTRNITPDRYRFTIESLYVTGATETAVVSTATWTVKNYGGTVYVVVDHSGNVPTPIDPSQPITVDMFDTTVVITGTGGTVTLPKPSGHPAVFYINVGAQLATATDHVRIGRITVQSYGVPSSIAETSDAVQLTPDDAWLIHPGSASLSMSLSDDDMQAASIVDVAPVENQSNATVHKILGSATPVPTTTGPRGDDRTTLTVATITADQSTALRALLASDVPLLIQIPPSWGLDFNSGFYQVGDTASARRDDLNMARRTWSLPIQKVQSPVVDIENTGWSYASAAAEFSTYVDLTTNFATYADLAANSRI